MSGLPSQQRLSQIVVREKPRASTESAGQVRARGRAGSACGSNKHGPSFMKPRQGVP
jgi:hypothetical protein